MQLKSFAKSIQHSKLLQLNNSFKYLSNCLAWAMSV